MQSRNVAQAKAAKKANERSKHERFTRIKNLEELTQMQRAYLMDIPDEKAASVPVSRPTAKLEFVLQDQLRFQKKLVTGAPELRDLDPVCCSHWASCALLAAVSCCRSNPKSSQIPQIPRFPVMCDPYFEFNQKKITVDLPWHVKLNQVSGISRCGLVW